MDDSWFEGFGISCIIILVVGFIVGVTMLFNSMALDANVTKTINKGYFDRGNKTYIIREVDKQITFSYIEKEKNGKSRSNK